jgi:sulfotransferase family protein
MTAAPMTAGRPIDVVAIAGTGQNGATLASRLMGEVPTWVAVGEIARLWDKGLTENVECSCGEPFLACPFWTRVGEAAFGGWTGLDGAEARRLVDAVLLRRRRVPRAFALPLLVFPRLSPAHARDARAYADLTRRLFGAVLEVSGAATIVDSSKWPAHVYLLSRSPYFRTRVVHLVRDARGVAYSNTKQVARQGSREDRPFRPRQRPWKVSLRWVWINVSSHALRLLGVPVLRLRYESLATDPRAEVLRITRFALSPDPDLAHIRDGEADLPAGHLVAGNRMRLVQGPVTIRPDDGWRSNLPPVQRRLVTLLAWPMLRLYGYVGTTSRRSQERTTDD